MYVNSWFSYIRSTIYTYILYTYIYTEIYSQTMLNNEIKGQTKSNRNYIWIVVIANKVEQTQK